MPIFRSTRHSSALALCYVDSERCFSRQLFGVHACLAPIPIIPHAGDSSLIFDVLIDQLQRAFTITNLVSLLQSASSNPVQCHFTISLIFLCHSQSIIPFACTSAIILTELEKIYSPACPHIASRVLSQNMFRGQVSRLDVTTADADATMFSLRPPYAGQSSAGAAQYDGQSQSSQDDLITYRVFLQGMVHSDEDDPRVDPPKAGSICVREVDAVSGMDTSLPSLTSSKYLIVPAEGLGQSIRAALQPLLWQDGGWARSGQTCRNLLSRSLRGMYRVSSQDIKSHAEVAL